MGGTLSLAKIYHDTEAIEFINNASNRCFELHQKLAAANFAADNCGDFCFLLTKQKMGSVVGKELVAISRRATNFHKQRMRDKNLKDILQKLKRVGDFYILEDDFFSAVLINISAVKVLVKFKNIPPYSNRRPGSIAHLSYYPDIHDIFAESSDPEELSYYWVAWRDINMTWMALNFFTVTDSIKQSARLLGIPTLDFWYQSLNIIDIFVDIEAVMEELREAFVEVHAFIRNELFLKYGEGVINLNEPIPIHLIYQVLMQIWTENSIIDEYFPYEELPRYDDFIQNNDPLRLIKLADIFYQSIGFDPLDKDFYQNRLKQLGKTDDDKFCKPLTYTSTPNGYMKYSKVVNFKKFMHIHESLARIHYAREKKDLPFYYFNSYDIEFAVGKAVSLSARTPEHLIALGIAKKSDFNEENDLSQLLRMCIRTFISIPICYVHLRVMHEVLCETVKRTEVNKRFWKLLCRYVGVEPPQSRPQDVIDFSYTFYMDTDQNPILKKFLGGVLGYQLYSAFHKNNGGIEQLHEYNFSGDKSVGNVLREMMALGSSEPWPNVVGKVLQENTYLEGSALLEYYDPALNWISNLNSDKNVLKGWNLSSKSVKFDFASIRNASVND
ncbi:angiotensin-converting enzyme-like isoform X1 [Teleopsis dalmanni]|uniref:angiotensin-converting enzyme-like isoform X1 n=1 Tax=Teleopsis dalmanni TaxID=139649 RepID=UPI0018CCF0A2|nr:angiotensin-converting enzyme-like isoform X1 [Teleopsis dalmanni]